MSQQKSNNPQSDGTLGVEALGGLAHHLFSEGQAAVDTKPDEAIVWLVQCMRTLKQLPDNKEFLVAALYFIGRALAQLGRNEESVCVLQAAAYIGQQLAGETAIDNLYATASLFAAIGARALAHHWFQEACKRYEALGLSDKITDCQQEIARTAPRQAGKSMEASTNPVEIIFLLEGQVQDHVTISDDGTMQWQ